MNSGTMELILFLGLVLLGIISVAKFFSWSSKKYYKDLLRGHLREDYIQNNPDLVRKGKVVCHCSNARILLRDIERVRYSHNVIRGHICDQCGTRLYYSVSGEYFENIVRELRKDTSFTVGVPISAPSK